MVSLYKNEAATKDKYCSRGLQELQKHDFTILIREIELQ